MSKYVFVFLLIPILGFSQNLPTLNKMSIDSTSNTIKYTSIIKLPKNTSDQIYIKVRAWTANTFNSANHVLQMDDKAGGILIAKGIYTYTITIYPVTINYILTINIKPEKCRITITNFTLQVSGSEEANPLENLYGNIKRSNGNSKNEKQDTEFINMLNDVDNRSNGLIKSLNSFIVVDKKDDF